MQLLTFLVLGALLGQGVAESARPLEAVTNSIGMRLVLVPAGEFAMGCDEASEVLMRRYPGLEAKWVDGERPLHRVRITRPFFLGRHEVTVGQFRQFVAKTGYRTDAELRGDEGNDGNERDVNGNHGGQGGWGYARWSWSKLNRRARHHWADWGFAQADDHPVVNVSWNDAAAFCRWLSEQEGVKYRLPTEAEWEYACRAGTTTRFYCGDEMANLPMVANVRDAAAKAKFPWWKHALPGNDGHAFTAPVGSYSPNAFGLFDMHGNAWEWCADWYDAGYYVHSPEDDPPGPATGTHRVARGGSWWLRPDIARSAFRIRVLPTERCCDTGFRVARDP